MRGATNGECGVIHFAGAIWLAGLANRLATEIAESVIGASCGHTKMHVRSHLNVEVSILHQWNLR